ncbi:hypothetical protein MACH09_04470 [Vibrio sp. MACH09]|uniref:ribonuclease regulator n=1 Tax=Vibrio sp. MACH09 TaxID=3025122 RepID=UPI00278FA8E5|nr:ribonuclease regulator [Vibrio sp. MACH09]GLO59939.1 hypothetical protein MACH09_04470 [Vibrio sp. MACH09]
MRIFLFIALLMSISSAMANGLPDLSPNNADSPHKLFISSQNKTSNEFDTWKIDSGYSYSIFDSIDVYVGARVDNASEQYSERGFLSGVSYSLGEKFSLKSTLHTNQEVLSNGQQTQSVGAEVSSRVQLSDNIDLHATLDYQEWQQGIEFGLGFRF